MKLPAVVGLLLVTGCAAPVTMAANGSPTGSPSPGPAPAAFVGLWVRADKPDEGIGFSDGGVWTAFRLAKPTITHPYSGDGTVAAVDVGRGHKHFYVNAGGELISVQNERVVRYRRVVFFPMAAPVASPSRQGPAARGR